TDQGHAYSMLSNLFGEGLGKPDNAEFCGAVDSAGGRTDLTSDGGDIDDLSRFAFDHGRQYGTAGKKDRAQIRLDESLEIFIFKIDDRPENANARGIDKDVDGTHRGRHLLEQSFKLLFHSNVRRDHTCGRADEACRSFKFSSASGRQHHLRPEMSKLNG